MSLSESELIERFKAGDERAFEELYRTHYKRLYFFILRYVGGDGSAADDLAQETMLRAYKNLNRFETRARFNTWLFTIALNLIRSRFRKRPDPASLDAMTEGGVPESVAFISSVVGPEEKTDRGMLTTLFKEAIAGLPEKERAVFILREMEGLTFQEIAEINGESMRNQQKIKDQADRKLREFFIAKGIRLR